MAIAYLVATGPFTSGGVIASQASTEYDNAPTTNDTAGIYTNSGDITGSTATLDAIDIQDLPLAKSITSATFYVRARVSNYSNDTATYRVRCNHGGSTFDLTWSETEGTYATKNIAITSPTKANLDAMTWEIEQTAFNQVKGGDGLIFEIDEMWVQVDYDPVGPNRYWVGGTGTWQGNDGTNWSDASGGTALGGTLGPTKDTDVYFDSNSVSGSNAHIYIASANCNQFIVQSIPSPHHIIFQANTSVASEAGEIDTHGNTSITDANAHFLLNTEFILANTNNVNQYVNNSVTPFGYFTVLGKTSAAAAGWRVSSNTTVLGLTKVWAPMRNNGANTFTTGAFHLGINTANPNDISGEETVRNHDIDLGQDLKQVYVKAGTDINGTSFGPYANVWSIDRYGESVRWGLADIFIDNDSTINIRHDHYHSETTANSMFEYKQGYPGTEYNAWDRNYYNNFTIYANTDVGGSKTTRIYGSNTGMMFVQGTFSLYHSEASTLEFEHGMSLYAGDFNVSGTGSYDVTIRPIPGSNTSNSPNSGYVVRRTPYRISVNTPADAPKNAGISVAANELYTVTGQAYNTGIGEGTNLNRVHVYRTSNNQLIATINTPNAVDTYDDDGFGLSCAVSNTYIVVGAPFAIKNPGIPDNNVLGKAYVYLTANLAVNTSIPDYTLNYPDAQYLENDPDVAQFGTSVAVTDTYVAVGQPRFQQSDLEVGNTATGRVYVYLTSNLAVNTSTSDYVVNIPYRDLNGVSFDSENFGYSVSMNETYLVVGAPGLDTGFAEQERLGVAFVYLTSNLAVNTSVSDYVINPPSVVPNFGISTDISNNYIIIGAHDYTVSFGAGDLGRAYIYLTSNLAVNTSVSDYTIDAPSSVADKTDDHFGLSVAISDNWAAVGGLSIGLTNHLSSATFAGGGGNIVCLYPFSEWSTANTSRNFILNPQDPNTTADRSGWGASLALSNNTLIIGSDSIAHAESGGSAGSSSAVYNYRHAFKHELDSTRQSRFNLIKIEGVIPQSDTVSVSNIDITGCYTFNSAFVGVQDETNVDIWNATDSTDSANNVGWTFTAAPAGAEGNMFLIFM